jgi:KUP system potassium uptake protein
MAPTGRHPGAGSVALTVGALGVVFGDIGTSPLYALHALFSAEHHAVHPDTAAVYGVISLVFWTITLIVSVKYVTFLLRADNEGEGGIMALIALVQRLGRGGWPARSALIGLGIFGASLFYGDGMITPAISVLSAVEGLKVATPSLSSLVVPIALVVLTLLFGVQRYGTGAVGRLFGPVIGIWFAVLAVAGLRQVIAHPEILRSLSPSYGAAFLSDHRGMAFVALASVVLTITGAEALYADVGHFGAPPIRRAWFLVVYPALMLNYMGQGVLILRSPRAIENPFFLLIPHWGRLPMVALATVATVIASQAVISGAFSLTHQAVQLGFLPRMTFRHTSAHAVGQIYAPAINWALCAAVAALVVGFGSSARLAGAYGVAVTGTMAMTTVLFLVVVRELWGKPLWLVLAGAAVFLTVELTFVAATLTKVPHGGWIPLAVGLAVFTVLTTWHRGLAIVTRNRIAQEGPLRDFVEEVRAMHPPIHRPPGTAVFLNTERDTTPLALRDNVEHNHVLHQSVVIIRIKPVNVPYVDVAERVTVDDLGYSDDGITHLTARYGFRDRWNLPQTVAMAARHRLEGSIDVSCASYFLSRITIVRTATPVMPAWRKRLFVAMARNEADPTEYLGLPDERTVTMGSLIEI